ncbi:MAG: hypothetical protein U0573_09045 [Phycisphaerales bacterium]|nr:hypothetical protein [Planctomycetota bacterium]
MRTMMCGLLVVCGSTAAADITQTDSLRLELRNFNDYPSSIILSNTSGTSGAQINEAMNPPGTSDPQKFANRHFAMLSSDGGASRLGLMNRQNFHIAYRMQMISNVDLDGSGLLWNQQPEGGIFFGNDRGGGFIDEGGIFVVGNGTVFVGGANQQFSLIGDHNNGTDAFTKGDLLHMEYRYYAPGIKGSEAAYKVTFDNISTGFHKEVTNTFDPGGADANGFNDGSWAGFRWQHTRNPLVLGGTVNDITYSDIAVSSCQADLNGDDQVDDSDFVVFVGQYNDLLCPDSPAPCTADLNFDSQVDDSDFVVFVSAYNELLCG